MALDLATVKKDLEATRPSFEEMNMNKVSFAKELEWAMQIFQGNDYLLKMEASTVKNALVNIALTGLTLNPVLKMAYLVPRKGKCCVDPSYMGLIKIATDTGSVKSMKAKAVYSNEPFEIEQGTNGFVKHGICKDGKKGKRIGAYGIAVLNDGSNHVEWMYEEELIGIRKRSESVKAGKVSPWDTDEDEMVRKTVVKRHWKYLPKSDRAIMMSQAIAFDDDANGIDFDKEKEELQRKRAAESNQPGSTPDADGEAYATDEDFVELFKLLADENLGDVFVTPNVPPVASWKASLEKKQVAGSLLKDRAEEYIKFFNYEINKAIELKNASAGEDGVDEQA